MAKDPQRRNQRLQCDLLRQLVVLDHQRFRSRLGGRGGGTRDAVLDHLMEKFDEGSGVPVDKVRLGLADRLEDEDCDMVVDDLERGLGFRV